MSESENPRRGRRLKNLHLDRVDLVRDPANPGAHVTLFKADEVGKMLRQEDGKWKLYDKEGKKLLGTFDSKADAMKRMAQVEHFGDKAKKPFGKAEPQEPYGTTGGMMSLDKTKLSEPVRKHLEDLEATDPTAAEALAEALAATQVEAPSEDVVKSQLAQLQKQLDDAKTEARANAEKVAKMEADAKLAGFVTLAKGSLEPIGKAEEVAEVLLAASEAMPTEKYQALERLLKGAAAQLATGEVFKQRTNVEHEATDAEAKLEELAKEAFKAGVSKTIELAKLHVIQSNPELYREIAAARDEQ